MCQFRGLVFNTLCGLLAFTAGYFLTKIFHPNIATSGEICVNALKKDWNPSLGLRHVLMVFFFLFKLI